MKEVKEGLIKAFKYLLADVSLAFLLILPIVAAMIYQDNICYYLYLIILPALFFLIRYALKE